MHLKQVLKNWTVLEDYLQLTLGDEYEDYSHGSWRTTEEWGRYGYVWSEDDITYIPVRGIPDIYKDDKQIGHQFYLSKRGDVVVKHRTLSVKLLHTSKVKKSFLNKMIQTLSPIKDFYLKQIVGGKVKWTEERLEGQDGITKN